MQISHMRTEKWVVNAKSSIVNRRFSTTVTFLQMTENIVYNVNCRIQFIFYIPLLATMYAIMWRFVFAFSEDKH